MKKVVVMEEVVDGGWWWAGGYLWPSVVVVVTINIYIYIYRERERGSFICEPSFYCELVNQILAVHMQDRWSRLNG